jgi:hypothetical protein
MSLLPALKILVYVKCVGEVAIDVNSKKGCTILVVSCPS